MALGFSKIKKNSCKQIIQFALLHHFPDYRNDYNLNFRIQILNTSISPIPSLEKRKVSSLNREKVAMGLTWIDHDEIDSPIEMFKGITQRDENYNLKFTYH